MAPGRYERNLRIFRGCRDAAYSRNFPLDCQRRPLGPPPGAGGFLKSDEAFMERWQAREADAVVRAQPVYAKSRLMIGRSRDGRQHSD